MLIWSILLNSLANCATFYLKLLRCLDKLRYYKSLLTSNSQCFRHSWYTQKCASSSSHTNNNSRSSNSLSCVISSSHFSPTSIDIHSVYIHTICSSREPSWKRSPGGLYSLITNLSQYNISRRIWIWNKVD